VKQRRADQRSPAGAQRDLREQRRGRVERLGLLAVGPLRRPGRAAREQDDAASRPRRDEFAGVAAVDELLEGRTVRGETRRPGLGLGPRDEAQAPARGGADALGELRVADDRAGVLAGADRRDLRAGEGGVEQQRVRAQLGAATSASTKPRWLRQRIAIMSSSPIPASRHACASAFVRRCISAKVSSPSSSMIAVAPG